MDSRLCSSCIACFDGKVHVLEIEGTEFAVHHATPNSFAMAVNSGCPLCRQMWTQSCTFTGTCFGGLWDGWKSQLRDQPFTCFRSTMFNNDFHAIFLKLTDTVPGPRLRSLYRILVPQEDIPPSPASDMTSEDAASLCTTGDQSVVRQVAKWVESCKSHPQCSMKSRSHVPPTRLLDLNPPEGPHMFRVQSTEWHSNDHVISYCTLSHCWGDGKGMLKLENRTMKDLYAGKRKTALPLTFREAMDFALKLEIRYMWIDSLCIIQDDMSDWGSESLNMSYIYANAEVNIAATANPHPHMRLFRERRRDVVRPVLVSVSAQPFQSYPIQPGQYGLFDMYLWTLNITEQPLNRRAWVFQERLMSPRIVHFTKDQVIWQCRSMNATEVYPTGVLPAIMRDSGQGLLHRRADVASWIGQDPCQSLRACNICRQWGSLVQSYSKGNLTFPDDRPVAVLGLAKEVEQLIQDRYVLGMFRHHLLRQLCWADLGLQHNSVGGTTRHPSYRQYSSFSWLSLDGEIRTAGWKCDYLKFLADVVELRSRSNATTNDNSPEYRLVMRGSLIPVELRNHIDRDRGKSTIEIQVSGMSRRLSYSNCHVYIDKSRQEGPSMLPGATHVFFPLALEIDHRSPLSTTGLLLELVPNDLAAYRRIGLVEMIQPEPSDNEPGMEIETLMAKHRVEGDIILV